MAKKRESHKILETFNFATLAKNTLRESEEDNFNKFENIRNELPDLKMKISRLLSNKNTVHNNIEKITELLTKINDLEDHLNFAEKDIEPTKKQPLDIKQ